MRLNASIDVGSVGIPGSATLDGVVYEVKASGADIWGTADGFRVVYDAAGGARARELTARVRSVSPAHAWSKAGVMFRQYLGLAGSPHVMVVVTPGKGVAMQYRPEDNAPSIQVGVRAGVAPEWVRLTQVEGTFRGYTSEDGVNWHLLGTVTVDWPLELSVHPCLAATSHNNTALTTAIFENVQLRSVMNQ